MKTDGARKEVRKERRFNLDPFSNNYVTLVHIHGTRLEWINKVVITLCPRYSSYDLLIVTVASLIAHYPLFAR